LPFQSSIKPPRNLYCYGQFARTSALVSANKLPLWKLHFRVK
jgi:hypothetical protein